MDRSKEIDLNLLQKTELWVEGVSLENARLDEIARGVAEALELEPPEVMVVDVREDHLVLDILRPVLKAGQIAGKEKEILHRLAGIPGVHLAPNAGLHSEGALGWVCLDQGDYEPALKKSQEMGEEIRRKVARRAIVFSTGFEVEQGLIADTNFPLMRERLEKEGYNVCFGGILPDDAAAIAWRLQGALDEGYGLILTSGGVGAEEKDCTVEALLKVDAQAAAPYILKFEAGKGRHAKDGVRIAVGRVGLSLLIALPGPTREVQLGLERLLDALAGGWDEKKTAEHIAAGLREKWKFGHKHIGHR